MPHLNARMRAIGVERVHLGKTVLASSRQSDDLGVRRGGQGRVERRAVRHVEYGGIDERRG